MWKIYALLALITLIGGTTPIAAQKAVAEIPPLTLAVIRFGVAGTLLWVTARHLGLNKPVPQDKRRSLIWVALLCVPINQLGFLYGIKLAGPTHAGIAYALVPVLIYWFSIALGYRSATRALAIASALAFIGAAGVVATTQQITGSLTLRTSAGDALLLLAAISWALFSVFSKPLVIEIGAVRTLGLVFLLGSLFQIPLVVADAIWFELSGFQWSKLTWQGVAGLAFLTIITAYLNYLLWYVVTARHDVTKSAVVTNAHFLVTVMLESLLVGTAISWKVGVASAILFAGVAIASIARDNVKSMTSDQTASPA